MIGALRRRAQSGFTLVEVAIVLVILGLLLAGIFKGQELITAARVRGLVLQQEGIRAAYLGFLDRYRQPPGDYSQASLTIPRMSSAVCGVAGHLGNGNGDGRIEQADGEHILAWEHLAKAGLLSADYTCSGNTIVNDESVPRNPYGQYLQLVYDNAYAGGVIRDQHNLKTGNNIPSPILREIDLKVDDGNALQGMFRGSTYTSGAPTDSACWAPTTGTWSNEPSLPNCGGALLF